MSPNTSRRSGFRISSSIFITSGIGHGSAQRQRLRRQSVRDENFRHRRALDNARHHLKMTFFSINGKIITDIDISAALETHRQERNHRHDGFKENRARKKFKGLKRRWTSDRVLVVGSL